MAEGPVRRGWGRLRCEQGDEVLLLVDSVVAGTVVEFVAVIEREAGTVQRMVESVTVPQASVSGQGLLKTGAGLLGFLSARTTDPRRAGEVVVRAFLRRGQAGNVVEELALLSGKLMERSGVHWPNGPTGDELLSSGFDAFFSLTSPGAGNPYDSTGDFLYCLRPECVRFLLTTSVAVANRRARLVFRTGFGGSSFSVMLTGVDQAASLAYEYVVTRGDLLTAALQGTRVLASMPMPACGVTVGAQFGIEVDNLQAADTLTGIGWWGQRRPQLMQ